MADTEVTRVTVDPGRIQQVFEGMGCGAIFYEGHITSLAERGKQEEQERLYDHLFRAVHTDFLHLMIRPDHEPANDNGDPYLPDFDAAKLEYCSKNAAIAAAARVRRPDIKLYAALYSPPAWMKTNGDPGGGGKARGTLKPGLELELGEYIWAFLSEMQRRGHPVHYLSICNEPDWEHTQPSYYLTAEAHAALFATVSRYLREMEKRFPSVRMPKLVAPNVLSAVDCADRYLPPTLEAAGDEVDVVGCHDYDRRGARWVRLRELAGPRPLWMTEWCVNGRDDSPDLIRSASEYWLAMTEAFNQGVNVWMAYNWVYPPRPGGEALIHLNWGSDYHLTRIYHGFRQWCAPLRPGMRVVWSEVSGAAASGISMPGVKAAAFADPDGRRLVVHLATVQDLDASVLVDPGARFRRGRFQAWRTGAGEDVKQLSDVAPGPNGVAIEMPGRSMCTVIFRVSGG